MHLTLHVQACCVISIIMEIDKRELSYHNPTYITEGNCYFGRLKANEVGRTKRAGRGGCLLVGDQMLSECIDRAAHGDASCVGASSTFTRNTPGCCCHHSGVIAKQQLTQPNVWTRSRNKTLLSIK